MNCHYSMNQRKTIGLLIVLQLLALALLSSYLYGCTSSDNSTPRPMLSAECQEIASYLTPNITPEGMQRLIDRYGSMEEAMRKLNECTDELKAGRR